MAKNFKNLCGPETKAYCEKNEYCDPLGECGSFQTHRARGTPFYPYSGKFLPKDCVSLYSEIELQQYNGFEEHESGYLGLELLITIGAGMISGVL